jgi:hypothetical protein
VTIIDSADPDMAEFERDDDGSSEPQLTLILTDRDDQMHRLTLAGRALRELATLFRAIQEKFPGILSD